jgi:DNA repair exonuclease SbcCD ATPase subunit
MSNKDVIELLKILQYNNAPTRNDFMALLKQVQEMESQLKAAVSELTAMRRELAEAQEQNHPAKNILQKAVIAMQAQVLELREKLAELKESVISGCKEAIAAFKEKGMTALDSIARFFKIKPILENIRGALDESIKDDDKVIAKIEAISTEYHQAGLHVKNMGRAIAGKEAAQEAKPPGKLAAVVSYPFRTERKIFSDMKKSAETAIGAIARLEEKAAERKPSIKKTLEELSDKVEREKAERPAPERARKIDHDR